MTKTEVLSNNAALADLAGRINTEHEACHASMQKGLEHALKAGALLLEAKAGLPHGEWLPWLGNNCPGISERSAQRYMRFTQNRGELESKTATVADLTIRAAEGLLTTVTGAPPIPPVTPYNLDDPDWSRFAESLLNAPFCADDFKLDDDGRTHWHWIATKMSHQISLPGIVNFCVGLHDDYQVPAMRLCDMGELIEALAILAPIAKWETKFEFAPGEFSSNDLMNASIVLTMTAQRLLVFVWDEIFDRQKKINAGQFKQQRIQTLSKLQQRIGARIKERTKARAT